MTYVLRLAKKGAIFFGGMYIGTFAVHLIRIFLGLFGIGATAGVAAASVLTGVAFMPVMFLSGRAEGYSDTLSGMYSIVKGPVVTLTVIMAFEALKIHGFLIFIFTVVAVGDAAGYIIGHKICLKRKGLIYDGETVVIPLLPAGELQEGQQHEVSVISESNTASSASGAFDAGVETLYLNENTEYQVHTEDEIHDSQLKQDQQ